MASHQAVSCSVVVTSLSSLLLLRLLCFLFLCVAVKGRTHHDDAEGAHRDMRALLEFKRCITSDRLSVLSDWKDDAAAGAAAPNVCNWTGISCSAKHPGRVVAIYLENATLRGSLSPHVANLSFLQVLDIADNTLSGQIPPFLATLHRLKVLDLCANEFEGMIPHQLGNLSSLQYLILCSNSLSGEIPASLGALVNLKSFNLFQNGLGGQIPSCLGVLNQLELLDLAQNNFHGAIHNNLENLSSLEQLSLSWNHLTGFIPCSLANLCRLRYVYIAKNNLAGSLPPCLGNLTALTELDLSYNDLQGHLPYWIGSFQKLEGLSLGNNVFAGSIPLSWSNITHLRILQLRHNTLSGGLPSFLGKLGTQLERLNLGQNYFTSQVRIRSKSIPFLQSLFNCSRLNVLDLNGNIIRGTLPLDMGSFWPNLQYLVLSFNFFSGKIPESLGNLSSLIMLRLSNNMFSSTIPVEIAYSKSLQYLHIQRNKLHGKIPRKFSLLNKTLGYLSLSGNTLSGSIPASIGELGNLRVLDLGHNMFSGQIPSEIGGCSVLESLVLSENNLSGAIPPEVAGLKTIVFSFDVSGNRLSGEVPPEIARLQMAQYINLSSNQFSENIALYVDSWLDARQINLSHNNFNGNLSSLIGKRMTQLQRIDLSYNNFTGSVPVSLFNLSYLQFLNFSHNKFDGEVPCLHTSSEQLKLTIWSFIGNENLCGRCFGLKACKRSVQQSISINSILKIVLCILGGLLLVVVAGVLLLYRRMRASETKIPRISEHFFKISVEELGRATDNFSALNLIGEGAHGKVYRGELMSGEVVAIKCYSYTYYSGAPRSFRRECRALAKARHRNVLKILTVVWSNELKAVVMPFMSNGNLDSLLHYREDGHLIPISLPTRLRLLRELAMGLGYLHHDCKFQIIHCDIKPENVLLDDDMTVKLSDFGIAHLSGDSEGSITSSSFCVIGSVGYIAPEYGIGEGISVKGDVYSFGVVTLEVITRLKPTHDMFCGHLTLSQWISMTLEGKSGEEKTQILKEIIKTADEGGGGIELDKDEEILAVESILKVGLRCTSQDARMRPDMKEVESILQSISIGDTKSQRTLPGNLEEVIKMVEGQRPFYPGRVETENSTSSD